MVSSSVTSNDGGVGVLQSEINNSVQVPVPQHRGPARSEVRRARSDRSRLDRRRLHLRRRLAGHQQRNQGPGGDDYGTYRLTSKSGKRLLVTGDTSSSRPATAPAASSAASTAISARTAASTSAPRTTGTRCGGRSSAARRARPTCTSAADGNLDLRNVDYTTADWQQVGGVEGAIYQWMGPDVDPLVGLDLSTANYLDLRYWKRVLDDEPSPVRASTSRTRTRPRSAGSPSTTMCDRCEPRSSASPVTAAERRRRALAHRVHPGDGRHQRNVVGRQSLNNGGTSLALGFVIATNVILSSASPRSSTRTITTTSGDVRCTPRTCRRSTPRR